MIRTHRAKGAIDPSLLKWVVLAAIIGGVAFFINSKMNPPALASFSVQSTEAFAVGGHLEMEHLLSGGYGGANVGKVAGALGGKGDMTMGGRGVLILTREANDGGFIQLNVALNRRFLSNHQAGDKDKLSLSNTTLKLTDEEDNEYEPLFLTGAFDKESISIGRGKTEWNDSDVLPMDVPAIGKWRSPASASGEIVPVVDEMGVFGLQRFDGSKTYSTASGMQANVRGGENKDLVVSWDNNSTAWRAAFDLRETVDPTGAWGDWNLKVLFPKPTASGTYTLHVHGQVVKTFSL